MCSKLVATVRGQQATPQCKAMQARNLIFSIILLVSCYDALQELSNSGHYF